MTILIETENHFFDWIVDYLHRMGPFQIYPKILVEAAEGALQIISEAGSEEDLLQDLLPEARDRIRHPLADKRILWPIFGLARRMGNPRPYSHSIMCLLARCFTPPVVETPDDAARVAFEVARLHETGYFIERRGKRHFRLETTPRGEEELGIELRLQYAPEYPFFSRHMIWEAGQARRTDRAYQRALRQPKKRSSHRLKQPKRKNSETFKTSRQQKH